MAAGRPQNGNRGGYDEKQDQSRRRDRKMSQNVADALSCSMSRCPNLDSASANQRRGDQPDKRMHEWPGTHHVSGFVAKEHTKVNRQQGHLHQQQDRRR